MANNTNITQWKVSIFLQQYLINIGFLLNYSGGIAIAMSAARYIAE
jgi:hypothetical protein